MGEAPDKEALGGARAQTRAGAVDNEAADEDDALAQLRRFLSYLPGSVWEAPPVVASTDDPATAARRSCCRSSRAIARKPYDMRRLLELVCRPRLGVRDRRAATAASLITALARLDGRPVGVLAADPKHYARRADRATRPTSSPASSTSATVPPAGRASSSTSPAS